MSTAQEYPAFLASEFTPAAADRARFHVIPVPYEHTVSYGAGTADGPRAILEASQQLEAFDGRGTPGSAGIHTTPPVDCQGEAVKVLQRITDAVARARARGAVPVVLGGEHTVTLGAVTALAGDGAPLGIVQIDAHADLRSSYEGTPYSHACVMRRVWELETPIAQFGVRSLCVEEQEFRRTHAIWHMDAEALCRRGLPDTLLPDTFPRRLYITIDVDGLDPSVIPATGTPEPGGLGWYQMLDLLARVAAGREVIGFDVVELAPVAGFHVSEYAAAKLVYYLMGIAGATSAPKQCDIPYRRKKPPRSGGLL
jgi:agmatinase